MTTPPRDERLVIPRWRSLKVSLAMGELFPLPVRRGSPKWKLRSRALPSLKNDFLVYKGRMFASDLIGAALVLGDYAEAREAAEEVVAGRVDAPPALIDAARLVLRTGASEMEESLPEDEDVGAQIHKLRKRLGDNPNNALAWVDLARAQTILGMGDRAARSMAMALRLAPEDRHVLRSAARLAIHNHRPDDAGDILLRSRPGWRGVQAGLYRWPVAAR
jgi:tetratricopeptide (TPR) repeat protein